MNLLEIWALFSSTSPGLLPSCLTAPTSREELPSSTWGEVGRPGLGWITGTPDLFSGVIETQKLPPKLRAESWCGPTLKFSKSLQPQPQPLPHPPQEGTWGQECRAGQSERVATAGFFRRRSPLQPCPWSPQGNLGTDLSPQGPSLHFPSPSQPPHPTSRAEAGLTPHTP